MARKPDSYCMEPRRAAAPAVSLLFVVVAGCTVHAPLKPIPDGTAPALAFERTANGSGPGTWPAREWWQALGDAQLSALVEEGLASNPDMDIAVARLTAAEARAAAAGAPLVASVDASGGAQRSRFSANGLFPPPIGGSTVWQNKASLDFRWDLDFWGRQRSALTGALRDEQAAAIERDLAGLTLSSSIARRYIEWQRLEDQIDLTKALLRQREGLLNLTQKRVDAGLDSSVPLRAAEAAVPDTRADLTALETQAALARIELAALVGAGPDQGLTWRRPSLQGPALSGVPSLVPADLLARRPDVTARRLQAEGAAARADAAKADFYPNINLAASVGLDSTHFDDWVNAGSRFYNAGPAFNLPLFGGGGRRATLKLRTAQYDEAVAAYRQTLIGAVRDVGAALTDLTAVDAEQRDAEAAVSSQNQSFELARRRYDGGLGTYTEVLVAEGQLLNQRRRIVDLSARQLDASVRLAAALGGGLPASPAVANR